MVSTGGGIVIAILVILLVSALAWVVFTQLRARRLGLPPPTLTSYIPFLKHDESPYGRSPSSGGPLSRLTSRFRALKSRNSRSAAGAYDETPARGNFGPLDPDDAWDSRVQDYGYEEDEETGYRGAGDRDLGSGYEMNRPEERRGRSGRNPFEDDVAVAGAEDPFGDGAGIRGVSPRPMERRSEEGDRRSAFREDV